MMSTKDITSLRSALEYLDKEGELLRIKGEVDPIYEVSGIQMALEGGPAILFENIKGYPGVRNIGNLFARRDRSAKLFDVADHRKLKFKCLEAMEKPIPPKVVEEAPCQEVLITDDIDVMGTLPIIKHTVKDAGRIIGGGNNFISGDYFHGGTHLSFNRLHFRGKDWSTILAFFGTHLGESFLEHKGQRVPMTINIGTPPAVMLVAGGSVMHTIIPAGTDKLGIAGGLQGSPVEIVKAMTVDAYSIAQSEWVIEGYVDTTQRVWESEEAEEEGKYGAAPFFPEWPGYLGRCTRTFKFQATAITHRKDGPIFYTPLAHSFEGDILVALLREACFYEMAQRLVPGFVEDVNIPEGVAPRAQVVFQVRKKRPSDEGYQRNIITAAFGATQGLYLVLVVDEDVDIYSADDLLWAITTRVDPEQDIMRGSVGGRGSPMLPIERLGTSGEKVAGSIYKGGLGIDATVPFEEKWQFERGKYPVDLVDLGKWLTEEEIEAVRTRQSDMAKVMSRRGW
jgi:4-hydroxy-3-polyprenylbenzoate decarboxylase